MFKKVKEVLKSESGQGMAEYGLIIALVAIAVIIAITALGGNIAAKFKDVGDTIGNASPVE